MNRDVAEQLLQTAVGDRGVRFHPGQWEAIDALVNNREKLLVVERTGWGKSSVYFVATRAFRDQGKGPTIIVSPLLALMRNQIEAARRLGIAAVTMNSSNRDDWDAIRDQVRADEVDAMLISPERLANDDFVETVLQPIAERVGLLVVDEAHCISDWGHDFRPDYQRLVGVLRQLPRNTPFLGTTATANDRVVQDIQAQIGGLRIQRGPLARDSLRLQTLRLPDQAARLAWLAETVPHMPGSGIVYVLTQRDAIQVAEWLQAHGVAAEAYFSGVTREDCDSSDMYTQHLEDQLMENELKVLVSTTALGMGYDKPDLGFVIHYQAPSSIVTYYQQVGRAGRAIPEAYGVLLSGREDNDIHDYFRRNAFPDERDVIQVLDYLEQAESLSLPALQQRINLRQGQIEKVLKVLSVDSPAPVVKDGSRWVRTPVHYALDHERISRLTAQREQEWKEVQSYIDSGECLMAFLRRALDDPDAVACGVCSACLGQPLFRADVPRERAVEAARFLRHAEMPALAKKQIPADGLATYGFRGNLRTEHQAEEGRILSRWNDAGWGSYVAGDKHQGAFRDELVEAVREMIEQRWRPQPEPGWVTCVPSLNHPRLVPDFGRRLAQALDLPFVDAVAKVRENAPQKEQQNRFHQCRNLDGVFEVADNIPVTPVLLVDDVWDSGWTMTVVAALLRRSGSGPVFPVALASSAGGD